MRLLGGLPVPLCPRASTLALSASPPDLAVETLHDVGSAAAAVATLTATAAGAVVLAAALAAAAWLANAQYVLELRRRRFRPSSSKSRSVAPDSAGFVPPHAERAWTEAELAALDGRGSTDGPILLAADGLVFNVASARNFYGPGGEYAVMAGTDASRYLARNSVERETAEEAAVPLGVAERAALGAWVWSLKLKYDVVGRLASSAEEAAMGARAARGAAYLDRLEEMSEAMQASSGADGSGSPTSE